MAADTGLPSAEFKILLMKIEIAYKHVILFCSVIINIGFFRGVYEQRQPQRLKFTKESFIHSIAVSIDKAEEMSIAFLTGNKTGINYY